VLETLNGWSAQSYVFDRVPPITLSVDPSVIVIRYAGSAGRELRMR